VARWQQVGGVAAVLLIVVLAAAWGVGLVGGDPGPPPSATGGTDDASPPPGPAEDDADVRDEPGGTEDPEELAPPEVTASREVAQPTLWLCGPDAEDDACIGDLDATVLAPDGSRTVDPFTPVEDPPVDCFYVYPTVSQAATRNAPLEITSAEREVARAQAARFGEVCRVVAPIYRQVTVQGLLTGGFRDTEARDLAFGDVVSAFNDHVASSGDRPFVLLGHSQGAQDLTRLVAERIEGDPDLAPRLVSALLIGGEVNVPVGEDVGGSFATVPACREPDQRGCVVAYNSFAETPPAFALFGRAGGGLEVLCVNPAALEGGAAPLTPYLPTATVDGFATPFATADGAVTGECRTEGASSWLQVDVDPDLRAAADAGGADLGPAWGLHVGDVNLALGDLVELVRAQTAGLS
jgi:hypothetical protein